MFWLFMGGNIVLILVLGLSLRYIADRRAIGPEAARKQLARIGPAWGGALLIGMVLSLLLVRSGLRSWLTIVFAVLALMILSSLGMMIWRRRHAGRSMLDLGKLPRQKLLLIGGGLVALSGLIPLVIAFVAAEPIAVGSVAPLFELVMAGYFVYMGSIHQEIRDEGIVYCGTLIPWRRIISYHWDGQRERLLMLTVKGGWWQSRSRTVLLPIGSVSRVDVDHILARYLAS